jgi:hypothetical protein
LLTEYAKNNTFNQFTKRNIPMRIKGLSIMFTLLTFFQFQDAINQDIIWHLGIHNFFDNREYFNNYVQPQSMLGTRVFGDIGLSLDKNNQFCTGANILYEYGSSFHSKNISPVIYFKHQSEFAQVNMGAFPRKDLIDLPYVLQTDTFQYYRPNVEGIFLKFHTSNSYQKLWLDWTSRQTNTDRETFLIGATGNINSNILYFRYDFIMYHYAGTAIPDTNDHIRDNGGIVLSGGLNLSKYTALDSLTISPGIAMSYDQHRNVYELDYRFGSITKIFGSYKGTGIRSTTYFGEGQTQMVGDGLYSAKFYSRLDLFIGFFRKSRVKSRVEFSLHFLPEVVDVSQQFFIYLSIGGKAKQLKKENLINW